LVVSVQLRAWSHQTAGQHRRSEKTIGDLLGPT
jgi:hypothetical protein